MNENTKIRNGMVKIITARTVSQILEQIKLLDVMIKVERDAGKAAAAENKLYDYKHLQALNTVRVLHIDVLDTKSPDAFNQYMAERYPENKTEMVGK